MRITRTYRLFMPVVPVAAVTGLLLAGCGGDEGQAAGDGGPAAAQTTAAPSADDGGSSVEARNTADVDFATGMIPHHGQAIEMADLAQTKASSPKVKDLAGRVKEAQDPEITTLSTMLTSWDEPVPAATGHTGAMPGMDHGDASMMTSEDMAKLEAATGADFDRMWVDMMIAHHEGAVRMSETEIRNGSNEKAKELAQTIVDAQTKEIAELKRLRTDLG